MFIAHSHTPKFYAGLLDYDLLTPTPRRPHAPAVSVPEKEKKFGGTSGDAENWKLGLEMLLDIV